MYSKEYSTLVKDGEIVQRILPNVEFDSIAGGCVVTAYARVIDGDNQILLKPGQVTDEPKALLPTDLGELSAQELRELCIEQERSFPKKATKAKLIDILEG